MLEPLFLDSCIPEADICIKIETLTHVLFCEFCEMLKIYFTEYIQPTASDS